MQIKKTRRCLVSAMCHPSPQQRGWNQRSTINQSCFDPNSRYFSATRKLPNASFSCGSSTCRQTDGAVVQFAGNSSVQQGVKKDLLQLLLLAANIPAGAKK